MTIETAGFCLRGHDLAVLGKDKFDKCRACRRAQNVIQNAKPQRQSYRQQFLASYDRRANDARYANTCNGQITRLKVDLNRRMNQKIARIDELERMLNA